MSENVKNGADWAAICPGKDRIMSLEKQAQEVLDIMELSPVVPAEFKISQRRAEQSYRENVEIVKPGNAVLVSTTIDEIRKDILAVNGPLSYTAFYCDMDLENASKTLLLVVDALNTHFLFCWDDVLPNAFMIRVGEANNHMLVTALRDPKGQSFLSSWETWFHLCKRLGVSNIPRAPQSAIDVTLAQKDIKTVKFSEVKETPEPTDEKTDEDEEGSERSESEESDEDSDSEDQEDLSHHKEALQKERMTTMESSKVLEAQMKEVDPLPIQEEEPTQMSSPGWTIAPPENLHFKTDAISYIRRVIDQMERNEGPEQWRKYGFHLKHILVQDKYITSLGWRKLVTIATIMGNVSADDAESARAIRVMTQIERYPDPWMWVNQVKSSRIIGMKGTFLRNYFGGWITGPEKFISDLGPTWPTIIHGEGGKQRTDLVYSLYMSGARWSGTVMPALKGAGVHITKIVEAALSLPTRLYDAFNKWRKLFLGSLTAKEMFKIMKSNMPSRSNIMRRVTGLMPKGMSVMMKEVFEWITRKLQDALRLADSMYRVSFASLFDAPTHLLRLIGAQTIDVASRSAVNLATSLPRSLMRAFWSARLTMSIQMAGPHYSRQIDALRISMLKRLLKMTMKDCLSPDAKFRWKYFAFIKDESVKDFEDAMSTTLEAIRRHERIETNLEIHLQDNERLKQKIDVEKEHPADRGEGGQKAYAQPSVEDE